MLIGLAIYVGIGAAVTALMWPMNRPTTTREWLMFPAVLMLWPPVAAFAVYMALSDKGY